MRSTDAPSPTLTNPDMILPYGDISRASTPSPPPQSMHMPVGSVAAGAFAPNFSAVKLARAPPGRRALSMARPVTPPMDPYGDGTELSDIEEIDTAENTPVQRRSRDPGSLNHYHASASPSSSSTAPRATPSPSVVTRLVAKQDYLPHHPDDAPPPTTAMSIITFAPAPKSAFDPDDEDEEGEEGEDEDESDGRIESVANGHGPSRDAEPDSSLLPDADRDMLHYRAGAQSMSNLGRSLSSPEDDEVGERPSSAALGMRAERILANAKKRLDNMEGNLNRARHSLIISPSPSMSPSSWNLSPASTRTTPGSPPNGEVRVHLGVGVSPAKHRQHRASPLADATTSNHARVFSETSVPSSLQTVETPPRDEAHGGLRARSVMSGLLTHRQPRSAHGLAKSSSVREVRYKDSTATRDYYEQIGTRNYLSALGSYNRFTPSPEAVPTHGHHHSIRGSGVKPHNRSVGSLALETEQHEASHGLRKPSGLSRSQSTMQMRDVRDQMKDLKGRISSLRQRAREDHLRRRSLQSLRTPSPFTAAEQWYLGANGYKALEVGVRPEMDLAKEMNGHFVDGEDEEVTEASKFADAEDEVEPDLEGPEQAAEIMDLDEMQDDGLAEDELMMETEAQVEPEETSLAVGERHEDRADAFDYEHFYLHSGLGHYSQNKVAWRQSTASYGSTDSVETARAVEVSTPGLPKAVNQFPSPKAAAKRPNGSSNLVHLRQVSNVSTDSISTVATFATATEGHDAADSGRSAEATSEPSAGARTPRPVGKGRRGDRRSAVVANGGAIPPAAISTSPVAPVAPPMQETTGSSSSFGGTSSFKLGPGDRMLLEQVLESLGKVCLHLHVENEDVDESEMMRWRKRLHQVKSVLDEGSDLC
ncbi:MAG: hypothetical protein M1838_003643 [Thelocarpon superellum]|nr:MAG: hypothetical protein M1838_003643 [Thelocarpon superellum]